MIRAAFLALLLCCTLGCKPDAPQAPLPVDQKLDPDLNSAYHAESAGQFAAARELAAQYVAKGGARPAQAEFLIGLSFRDEKRNGEALAHFDRCAQLEPGYLASQYYRGMTALDLGQLAKARGAFETYLAVQPEKAEALFGLGLVEIEEDRPQDAAAHFEHAIALVRTRLAQPGDQADARRDLGRYLARLGDVYTRTGALAKARTALEESVKLLPDLDEPRAKLAHVAELERAGADSARAPAPTAASGRSIHFTDFTAHSGIDFTLTSGRFPPTQILEVKGGGLALVDYDDDGDLDLFVPNGAYLDAPDAGPGARLFENLGDLQFRDVTKEAGISFHGWGEGVAVGDYDGDGHDDLFVACFGRNRLLRNTGHKSFEDVTEAAGLDDAYWSTGASFGDLDGDGDLDLYVSDYLVFDPKHPPAKERYHQVEVFGGPLSQTPQPDMLWENLGDGRFRDASESSNIRSVKPGLGLGALILDFDGDGKQDVFVGNDSTPKFLLRNLGEMKFEDVGVRAGLAVNADGAAQATMGIAVGDVNGDGQPDLFTTNFADDTNTLFVSVPGRALWSDATRQFGLGAVSRPFVGWATWFGDYDLDGDEDLVVFNGHVYPQATLATMNADFKETPLLFARNGARFERVEAKTAGDWLAEVHADRSAVFGDLDGDGDLDVIVGELDGKLRVLRNDASGGHWLEVALHDARKGSKNHRGLGAKITLTAGSSKQTRWIFSGGSYQAANSMRAHFGLVDASKVALEVCWPDGTVQPIADVAIDRKLVVEHP
ncbi:MAG: VCBS repeat-containing protein [Planctomycetes bacterium]|nr:VCBS repeat-containing protein [Planctomycetota bacterium]